MTSRRSTIKRRSNSSRRGTDITQGEAIVDVNGVRLWTARHGSGPPLALLHGGPGLWDYIDDLAAMIDGTVEVHRYDQRGGGRSAAVLPYDVETFVADLDALRAHWGHERWTVAGHSWGASLALAYAVAHRARVEALVLIDGTGIVDDWREEYHANADARRTPAQRERLARLRAIVKGTREGWTPELEREYCVLTWLADYADPDAGAGHAGRLLRDTGPNYDANAALGADLKRLHADPAFVERVRAIDVPALVLHGALDPRPARLAERLAATLPDATLEIVPDAGHLPWVEQPGRVRDALRGFLARVRVRDEVAT